ncbi:hypothetical protein HHK36_019207 [Tetracentron sinense]|uniref:Kinesin motor domain-containing protein n=1 Tax=Tetracentron sinense TaxID=13715 RepID=A0A834YX75_TETSI|nr:hypothetical protein HHK36_019207 [Tetracentron sinense]
MASNSVYNRSSIRSDRQGPQGFSRSGVGHGHSSVRSKVPSARRSVMLNSRASSIDDDPEPGRVRVAVRLRPRNAEDLLSDADFGDCVELQPELKRLKLRKNNWSSESYKFDEVFTESASQRRVYEVVAKPVVESVLNGYNGTVMAYGQTGTGKTYTMGRLGKDDSSERGIMVRALDDIIANTSPAHDSVEVSYLQLYLESIQDLLAPEKNNIPIVEDPKTGEVSLPGAAVVKVQDVDHFLQLVQIGDANRHAADTKLNTESSRSHAILMVYIRRSVHGKVENESSSTEKDSRSDILGGNHVPTVLKSKLLIVDLAGSERIDKSGSEGHMLEEAKFINLSLTSLGKCINALAENSPHIPTRDSKLTRLLRDSFGGSARTSLIITIGPSARHHAETASTIMFGQRAMKIVNTINLKEEFDYESLCRKLEIQVDHLTAELERQQKLRDNDKEELEKKLRKCQMSFSEAEKSLAARAAISIAHNSVLHDRTKHIEIERHFIREQIIRGEVCTPYMKINDQLADVLTKAVSNARLLEMLGKMAVVVMGNSCNGGGKDGGSGSGDGDWGVVVAQHQLENSTYQKVLADTTQMYEKKIAELIKQLEDEHARSECAEEQLDVVKKLLSDHQKSIQQHQLENSTLLANTTQMYEKKIAELMKLLGDERAHSESAEEQLAVVKKLLSDHQKSIQGKKEIDELRMKLHEFHQLHEMTVNELESLKTESEELLSEKAMLNEELHTVRQNLLNEEKQRKNLEEELDKLKMIVPENDNDFEDGKLYMKENRGQGSSRFGTAMSLHKSNQSREAISGRTATIAKIYVDVQIHAVKVVANLAAEDVDVEIDVWKEISSLEIIYLNQEKIVEEGGLDALLMLLGSSQNKTIHRVASGAIANLAMNELNQVLIMSKGGAQLLANIASKTDDPQTLRMVAGAIANLCGNEKLHVMLKEHSGIKALLGMVRFGNSDVIAQAARGMANLAKCESRGIIQGRRKGRSLLMEDGALTWLIANSTTTTASTRRHIELAFCHLAQNEDNARDFISSGAVKELVRISRESSREDIRGLAKKTLRLSPTFHEVMHSD